MIKFTIKDLEKVEEREPNFVGLIKDKMNILAHIYFKSLDFLQKLGLERDFIDTLEPDELIHYQAIKSCR